METSPSPPELYLIVHKVRGEPAFDIAHRLMIGSEEGWVIPTSGHRAYPITHWKLDDLADVSDYPHHRPAEFEPSPPELDSAPDHYSHTPAARGQGLVKDLLSALGLPRTATPVVKRRI